MIYPLEWFNSLPEDFDDVPSFQQMLVRAKGQLSNNEFLRNGIVQENGEAAAVAEWDSVFGEEDKQYRELIEKIEARLAELTKVKS